MLQNYHRTIDRKLIILHTFQMSDNQKKTIKKLEKSIKKVKFDLQNLKNNEKLFNMNKYRKNKKKKKKEAAKNQIIDEKIRKGFENIVAFIQTQFPTNSE